MAIARQVRADLMRTTRQTFFKICPSELIDSDNQQEGLTVLKNKSMIYWLHLDKVDENTLRGLEINSCLVDQAEETEEKVYDVLDARIGRWDDAEIPSNLLANRPEWPRNKRTNKPEAPSYLMLLCNPDTQYHYIYRKYHPESLERRANYFFVEGEWDSSLGSSESYLSALEKGGEYVEKYVRGQWGISNAQIHRVHSSSYLTYSDDLLAYIKKKGNLFRVLDHGDASPTSCLWFASLHSVHVCYREYYSPGQTISTHRQRINELSESEVYSGNYADPQIFKTTAQKQGGFWSVADEYTTKDIEGKPLSWIPADNNEFATRNRINELLNANIQHEPGSLAEQFFGKSSPGLLFIKKSNSYVGGAYYAINEMQGQRRKLLGYVDGTAQYCDDREESVSDHAYDCVRYYVAMHANPRREASRPVKSNTFNYFRMMKMRKKRQLEAMSA